MNAIPATMFPSEAAQARRIVPCSRGAAALDLTGSDIALVVRCMR
jgi:hypothetical protein